MTLVYVCPVCTDQTTSVMLIPAYKPLLKVIRSAKKTDQGVAEGGSLFAVGLFQAHWLGDFQVSRIHITIKEYAEAVTSYIAKCSESERVAKIFTVRSNQKPWITSTLSKESRQQNAHMQENYRSTSVTQETPDWRGRTFMHWQTDKTRQRAKENDPSLSDRLNNFLLSLKH